MVITATKNNAHIYIYIIDIDIDIDIHIYVLSRRQYREGTPRVISYQIPIVGRTGSPKFPTKNSEAIAFADASAADAGTLVFLAQRVVVTGSMLNI